MHNPFPQPLFILRMVFGACALILLLNAPCYADDLTLSFPKTARQGQMVMGFVNPPSAVVKVQGKPAYVGRDGRVVLGIGRDQITPVVVTTTQGNQTTQHSISIQKQSWNVQKIAGLNKKYVTPDPKQEARIKADQTKIKTTRTAPIRQDFMAPEGFIAPAKGPISGVFGSQRILNGVPKAPHNGMDIAGPVGTPVIAPAAGVVALVDPDMFLTGKTVMLDHGAGVYSVFIHMNSIAVKVGDTLTQGDPLGTIGKTGRVSGPHLHWGMTVAGVPVDPKGVIR